MAKPPLAPPAFPEIPVVAGVRSGAIEARLRYTGRLDLALIALAPGTTVGGVFTRSAVPGHPIDWCRTILPHGTARALIVNAGNANVLGGAAGAAAVRSEAEAVAGALGCAPEEVLVASTGVIGEPLPVAQITGAVPDLVEALRPDGFAAAAEAILTTDTFPKAASATATVGDQDVVIAGIAKGSGMIQPDMATMLAFVFTDAAIPAPVLQALLEAANAQSFACTTVDSDTSTSDTLLAFATGAAGNPLPARADEPALESFRAALFAVTGDLAQQVVRDGEGASKFITIVVKGARDHRSARRIALAIANSPLVKTAIAGGDANWGRVAMAVGKAGEVIDLGALRIAFGRHVVAEEGARVPDLDEAPLAAHLAGREIQIEVGVGRGPGAATVWTCDLTHGYIAINADYRS